MSEKNISLAKMIFIRLIVLLLITLVGSYITNQLIKEEIAKKNKQLSVTENRVNRNQIVENKSIEDITTLPKEETIDLEGTFDVNKLKISFCKEEYLGQEIQYYKIDGLKNENIEKEINYSLKNDVKDFVDKAKDENKIIEDNFYMYSNVQSSFVNTLSIEYYFSSYTMKTDEYGNLEADEQLLNDYIAENFDLTTGERITANDLFVRDFKAQKLVNHDFYTQLVSSKADIEMNDEEIDLYVKDYNDIEEEMLGFVTRFNGKKDIKFVFDEQKIIFLDYGVNIFYEDYLDEITIYNKYISNISIFDGQYDALSNLPTLTKRYYADYWVIEQGQNYYMDISVFDVFEDEENRNETIWEATKKYVDKVAQEMRQKAEENPNEFYIFNGAYQLATVVNMEVPDFQVYDGILRLDINRMEYRTTKSDFNTKIYGEIQKVFRTATRMEGGEAYCYDNLFFDYIEINWEEDTTTDITEIYFNSEGEMFDNEYAALRKE